MYACRQVRSRASTAHRRTAAMAAKAPALGHELVYEYADCVVMSYSPTERGYEGVLAIRENENGVRLYVNQGKGLPDPEKLLRGSGKQARWIPLEGASILARPAVVDLIDEAIARNRVPFVSTGPGPVVIRSELATQRRRRRPA